MGEEKAEALVTLRVSTSRDPRTLLMRDIDVAHTKNRLRRLTLLIPDSRLYRQTHTTFESFCRERWKLSIAHGIRLIAAAEVVQNLAPIGAIPTHESQLRPLSKLRDIAVARF